MKTTAILALAAFIGMSSVAAAPLDTKRHFVEMVVAEKRGDDTVWVTVTSEVVETVDITTTIWVTAGQPAPSKAANAPADAHPTPNVVGKPIVPVPVAQPQPAAAAVSPAASPSPAPAAVHAPVVAHAPAAAPASVPAPVAAPAKPTTNNSPPPSGAGEFISQKYPEFLKDANQTYLCTESSPCGQPQDKTAKGSFYSMTNPVTGAIGTGACGTSADATSQDFVAVSKWIMGSLSSGSEMNPLCGVKITVKNTDTGKTASGTVMDKCPGCKSTWGIDLSNHMFDQLASESAGLFNVEYWFEA